jgi:hypothetical protein
LLRHPSSRFYLTNTRLLDPVLKYREFLQHCLEDSQETLNGLSSRASFGVLRKWLLSVAVFVLTFRQFIHSTNPDRPVHSDILKLVSGLHKCMSYLYFRFGIEVTTVDDDRVLRSISTAVVIAISIIPSFLFSSLMDTYIQISKLLSLNSADNEMLVSGHQIAAGEHRVTNGWTSGGDLSAGIVFDGVSVFRGEQCTINVRRSISLVIML